MRPDSAHPISGPNSGRKVADTEGSAGRCGPAGRRGRWSWRLVGVGGVHAADVARWLRWSTGPRVPCRSAPSPTTTTGVTAPIDEAVDWLVPDGADVAVDLAAGLRLSERWPAPVRRMVAVEPDRRMLAVLDAGSGAAPGCRTGRGAPAAGGFGRRRRRLFGSALVELVAAVPEIARSFVPAGCWACCGAARTDRCRGWPR